jgi:hypothetical protein
LRKTAVDDDGRLPECAPPQSWAAGACQGVVHTVMGDGRLHDARRSLSTPVSSWATVDAL